MKYSGCKGKVKVGSDTLSVKEWSADDEFAMEDTTATDSNCIVQMQPTLRKLTGKISAQWSETNNPYDPVDLAPGTAITNLELYVSGSDKVYDITAGWFTKASIKSAVEGIITWDLEFHANAFTVSSSSAS